jgi:hypothetical protein
VASHVSFTLEKRTALDTVIMSALCQQRPCAPQNSQLRTGKGILKVAAECSVGGGTVYRIKREMEGSRPLNGVSAAA